MREFIFATNNKNKLKEVREIAANKYLISCLNDLNYSEDIPEDFDTLEENALQKAKYIAEKFNVNCFADDTGLEVEALNGAPGVFSARYAGESKRAEDNVHKLLKELEYEKNRKARFRTVIALIVDNNEYLFEGVINGRITNEVKGDNGFGYDPVFIPDGFSETFAELSSEQKNKISHRANAIKKLFLFLDSYEK